MSKLTVALATFNEEKNIGACLDSVRSIADEIIIVDGSSKDRTIEIAEKYGAKIKVVENKKIFHINKQKALDMASHEWILQLDADEKVTPELAGEIKRIIGFSKEELEKYQENLPNKKLFFKHQELLEERDGKIGNKTGEYDAFFIPRLNYFLGKYLRYGGVYPDGVIRLVRRGRAHFPCKDVHEQIAVKGRVGWLQHDLIHMADPTLKRYLQRNNRYTDLIAIQLSEQKEGVNPISHLLILPLWWFGLTFIRHKGFLDSWQGFVFSFFSSLRFPISYIKYLRKKNG